MSSKAIALFLLKSYRPHREATLGARSEDHTGPYQGKCIDRSCTSVHRGGGGGGGGGGGERVQNTTILLPSKPQGVAPPCGG